MDVDNIDVYIDHESYLSHCLTLILLLLCH